MKDAIKEKNKAWKAFKKNKTTCNWGKFTKIRNQTNRFISSSKKKFELKIARQIKDNPKQFWNYVKAKRKKNHCFPSMIQEDGSVVSNDRQKANLFNNYFASVFTKENMDDFPSLTNRCPAGNLENINIKPETVRTKLSKLNPSKSAGPDNIHGKILKELSDQLNYPLSKIFNQSLNEGKIPTEWKLANVKPLFKKGSKNQVKNYRPVSLTSICGKTMERIIRDEIINHLEENFLISDKQHGFRSRRSCATQLIEIMEIWTNLLDKGIAVDCIYLDFAKAFDKVPHYRLLEKARAYGIRGKLLQWISDFLIGRTQRVKLNNVFSDSRDVLSGIPQGSVLGPTLFVIYINDIPDALNSYIRIFADDTKIFRSIQSINDSNILQDDITKLIEWNEKWQLKFNIEKCKVMHYGKSNVNTSYQMFNTNLEAVSNEKDLGVTFDDELKFSSHIRGIINKANSRLGIIKRNFSELTKEVFLPLYKSLVRPILEYCSCIWNPILKSDKLEIEKVQRRATKLVKNVSYLQYSERLRVLKLDSLAFRRRRNDVIQTFRIINKIDNIDPADIFEFHNNLATRGHKYKLKKPRVLHKLRQNSFGVRVVNDWNGLREETVSCNTIDTFKKHLSAEWKNHPERFEE